jgi:hypothetical protein
MMKILSAAMVLVAGVTAQSMLEMPNIAADSPLGMRLLSESRSLENNNYDPYSHTWVSGYSIKFDGCHHISQWNDEAVRFRFSAWLSTPRGLFGGLLMLYSCR